MDSGSKIEFREHLIHLNVYYGSNDDFNKIIINYKEL